MLLDQPLTTQEAFNIVVRHLHSMKFRSREGGVCVYHSPQEDGTVLKCAIGCLIPDKHYRMEIEGSNYFDLVSEENTHVDILDCIKPLYVKHSKTKILLGSELQSVHDSGLNWDDGIGLNERGVEELLHIANEYDLNPWVINKLKWR